MKTYPIGSYAALLMRIMKRGGYTGGPLSPDWQTIMDAIEELDKRTAEQEANECEPS